MGTSASRQLTIVFDFTYEGKVKNHEFTLRNPKTIGNLITQIIVSLALVCYQ